MDDALAKEINDLLAMELHSLLHHLHEATPYLTPRTYPIWGKLQAMVREDRDHARRLASLMNDLRLPQRPGNFPPSVGSFHYVTIERLLPLLLAEKRAQVAAYGRAIRYAARDPRTVDDLEALWADNNYEQEALEAIEEELAKATAADKPTPVQQTADLQNIANVLLAQQTLAVAKGEAPPPEAKPAKPAAKADKHDKADKPAKPKPSKAEKATVEKGEKSE